MEIIVITIVSLLFFRLLLVTANSAKKIPCKRHQWVTEEVLFEDGTKTYFMHCSICQMIPGTDTEATNYKEVKK